MHSIAAGPSTVRQLQGRSKALCREASLGQECFGLDDEFRQQLRDDTGVEPTWSTQAFSDLDEDVRESIARITSSPFVPHTDEVRGFVYDVDTGQLREVTP